jgi:LPXTG-site transpeptidase (sortase) family protein
LVAATPNGIAAFQPRPGSAATPKAEPIYRDSKQEKDVQDILNSIPEEPAKSAAPVVAAVSVSPPYIEVSNELEKALPEVEEIEEFSAQIEEVSLPVEAESLPEPEPEPEPEPVESIVPVVIEPEKTRSRKSAKVMMVLSDALITFAIFAIMYAGYQTVWSMYVSQQNIAEARAEVELKWAEDPAAEPELHKGFALIYIPRLKDKVWELPITRGVDPDDLVSGLGHYPDNALPGEKGNFAMAGHRATYGEPLANIDQLKQDDEVIIQTAGNWYVYKLVLDEIVEPDAMWVLDPNPGGIVNKTGVEEMITLTTCHPRWGSTERWIWWGVLTEVRPYDQVPESIAAAQEGGVQ